MSNITPAQALKKDLAKMKGEFKAALPSHIPVDKFLRTLQTAVSTAPNLIQANRHSLYASCMKAAQDGLLPDGKESAIVTFKNKQQEQIAQYMPMVSGILKKVRNSGELSSITSQVVYEKDDFEFYIDESGEHLNHKPNMFGQRGKKIGVYAVARTKDGGVYTEILTAEEVQAVKNVSRGKNGPWSGAFETEMWKKTAIKRLSKKLPMSSDLEFTIKADDDLYDLEQENEKPEKKEKSETPSRLSELMEEEVENQNERVVSSSVEDEEVPI